MNVNAHKKSGKCNAIILLSHARQQPEMNNEWMENKNGLNVLVWWPSSNRQLKTWTSWCRRFLPWVNFYHRFPLFSFFFNCFFFVSTNLMGFCRNPLDIWFARKLYEIWKETKNEKKFRCVLALARESSQLTENRQTHRLQYISKDIQMATRHRQIEQILNCLYLHILWQMAALQLTLVSYLLSAFTEWCGEPNCFAAMRLYRYHRCD